MDVWNLSVFVIYILILAVHAQEKEETMHKFKMRDETERETDLAYWREDIGLNFFHWRWHSVFPAYWKPKMGEKRDRVGEIFPYMHEQILARYDAERLSVNVSRVNGLHHWKGNTGIPEYNASHFTKEVAGRHYYSRPKHLVLQDMNPKNFDHMRQCYKKIVHDVRKGYLKMKNGTKILLRVHSDIELLGGVLLGSSLRHVFPRYCEFHGEGHYAFSHMHDVWDDDEDDTGTIAYPRASMRDPLFFEWHKLIEDVFWDFRKLLDGYKKEQLQWNSITVVNISIQGANSLKTNEVKTFWQKRNVTLNRGIDFSLRHPIKISVQHLQHEAFQYTIQIQNKATSSANGVVRIFLAPQKDENGQVFNVSEQSRLFMEMDKFVTALEPGMNTIHRHSDNSTITNEVFNRIAELTLYDGEDVSTEDDDLTSYCSCGYPNHLLLPRGKPGGMEFLLYVIVTDADSDMKKTSYPDCHVAPGYCGTLNDVYPDQRPMGFPFDRPPAARDLAHFKTDNMAYANIIITFYNITVE